MHMRCTGCNARLQASQFKRDQSVGANLFIGNLDPDVDEKLLYDTFSAFGVIMQHPKVMRDPDSGASKVHPRAPPPASLTPAGLCLHQLRQL